MSDILAVVDSEVILTLGRSRSLLKFFLEAKKKRSFQVVIAEGAPKYVASNYTCFGFLGKFKLFKYLNS